MQRVRAVVRKFILPTAIFATAGWALAFFYMFASLPGHGAGTALLLALGGVIMTAPWLVMAMGVIQRMRAGADPDPKTGEQELHGEKP